MTLCLSWWLNPPAFAASRRRNNGIDLMEPSVLAEGKMMVAAMCGLHVTYLSINKYILMH